MTRRVQRTFDFVFAGVDLGRRRYRIRSKIVDHLDSFLITVPLFVVKGFGFGGV